MHAAVTLCALHFLSCGLGLAAMRLAGIVHHSNKAVPLQGAHYCLTCLVCLTHLCSVLFPMHTSMRTRLRTDHSAALIRHAVHFLPASSSTAALIMPTMCFAVLHRTLYLQLTRVCRQGDLCCCSEHQHSDAQPVPDGQLSRLLSDCQAAHHPLHSSSGGVLAQGHPDSASDREHGSGPGRRRDCVCIPMTPKQRIRAMAGRRYICGPAV